MTYYPYLNNLITSRHRLCYGYLEISPTRYTTTHTAFLAIFKRLQKAQSRIKIFDAVEIYDFFFNFYYSQFFKTQNLCFSNTQKEHHRGSNWLSRENKIFEMNSQTREFWSSRFISSDLGFDSNFLQLEAFNNFHTSFIHVFK